MRKQLLIYFGLIIIFSGCALPGHQFININYLGNHEKIHSGTIGVADFSDLRAGMGQGYVGYRVLLDKSQETYMVQGLNLADTLKTAVMHYYDQNGFTTTSIEPWDLTPDGVKKASKGFNKILTGKINKFECRAKKRGGRTDMILDINLILYLGIADNTLKTIPVSFILERTEFTFNQKKLEQFINQALGEIIQKALILK
jgi:hypothetical protein